MANENIEVGTRAVAKVGRNGVTGRTGGDGTQHPGIGCTRRRKGFVAAQRGEDSGTDTLQCHLPGKRHQRKSPNRQKRQEGEVSTGLTTTYANCSSPNKGAWAFFMQLDFFF